MSEELVSYYYSKDKDIRLGRKLIDTVVSNGVQLDNKDMNNIIQAARDIYSTAEYNGMVKVANTLRKIAEANDETLPPATLEYIEAFEQGEFENEEAFNRSKERISKDMYYLNIADAVLQRSTCLRRRYGAVIVKNDEIVSTGYNGSPRGQMNCIDRGYCDRENLNIPKGERYEVCVAVHAEQNALLSAARCDTIGATLYIVGREVKTWEYADPRPCAICARMVKNAGISRIVGMYKGEVIEVKV